MIYYLIAFLKAFFFSLIIAVPYIGFLYRFNIRRIPKSELESVLPGRKVKMGTPIMGGFLIVFPLLLLSIFELSDWKYLPAVILIVVFGSVAGFADEYVNTLGRTFQAVRKSKSKKGRGVSLFSTPSFLLPVKRLVLIPWSWFEEALRVMGGEQRGIKNHYKLLLHLLIIVGTLWIISSAGFTTSLWIPFIGVFNLPSIIYYLFVGFLMLGFTAAFGITDGMDGLSAGTHFISFIIFGIYASYVGSTDVALLSFLIAGSELAFLYFNVYQDRLEMSDVGTVPLGILFVLIATLLHKELVLPLIGIVYVVEILSSVLQQWSVKLRGKRILLVAPIHHHFEKLGWHETKVVSRIWIFAVVAGVIGLLVMFF